MSSVSVAWNWHGEIVIKKAPLHICVGGPGPDTLLQPNIDINFLITACNVALSF